MNRRLMMAMQNGNDTPCDFDVIVGKRCWVSGSSLGYTNGNFSIVHIPLGVGTYYVALNANRFSNGTQQVWVVDGGLTNATTPSGVTVSRSSTLYVITNTNSSITDIYINVDALLTEDDKAYVWTSGSKLEKILTRDNSRLSSTGFFDDSGFYAETYCNLQAQVYSFPLEGSSSASTQWLSVTQSGSLNAHSNQISSFDNSSGDYCALMIFYEK